VIVITEIRHKPHAPSCGKSNTFTPLALKRSKKRCHKKIKRQINGEGGSGEIDMAEKRLAIVSVRVLPEFVGF
jgi:hypothetical protein